MAQVTFKGQKIEIDGKMIEVGDQAKNFTLVNQDLQNRQLESYQSKPKVMITVPSLDTSVCLKETKYINELAKKYSQVQFLVISADLPFAHKRICREEKIDNIETLSMMRSKKFAKDYGILMASGPLKGLNARSIYVVDRDDKVVYSQLVSEITQEPDYQKLEQAIREFIAEA